MKFHEKVIDIFIIILQLFYWSFLYVFVKMRKESSDFLKGS